MGWAAVGVQALGQIMNYKAQKEQVKAQRAAIRQEIENAILKMNRDFMNLEVSRKDAFDEAVGELSKIEIGSQSLVGSVDAAVNEEYAGGGNTGRLIQRSARADTERAKGQIKDNYKRQSNETDLNKETTWLDTKAFVKSKEMSMPQMPSKTALLVGLAGTALQGYTAMKQGQFNAKANGMEYNKWTGRYSNRSAPTQSAKVVKVKNA